MRPRQRRAACLALEACLALAACLVVLGSCAGRPPAISRVLARITCSRDVETKRTSESLSVFLVATDPDGQEDLSAFFVINDEAELFWKVESGQWVTATAEGEAWIGTNSLAAPESVALPGGEYRVVLQDAAGETVEQTFTIPADRPTAAEMAYPRADVKNGIIVVTGPYENTEVRISGSDGRHRMSFAAGKAAGPLEIRRIEAAIPGLGEEFTFRVWALDPKTGVAAESGPWSSRGLPRQ